MSISVSLVLRYDVYPSGRVLTLVLEHSVSVLTINATSYVYVISLLLIIASQDSWTEVAETSVKRSVSSLSTVCERTPYTYNI